MPKVGCAWPMTRLSARISPSSRVRSSHSSLPLLTPEMPGRLSCSARSLISRLSVKAFLTAENRGRFASNCKLSIWDRRDRMTSLVSPECRPKLVMSAKVAPRTLLVSVTKSRATTPLSARIPNWRISSLSTQGDESVIQKYDPASEGMTLRNVRDDRSSRSSCCDCGTPGLKRHPAPPHIQLSRGPGGKYWTSSRA